MYFPMPLSSAVDSQAGSCVKFTVVISAALRGLTDVVCTENGSCSAWVWLPCGSALHAANTKIHTNSIHTHIHFFIYTFVSLCMYGFPLIVSFHAVMISELLKCRGDEMQLFASALLR